MQTKTELLAELTDLKARRAEIHRTYEGQFLDPDSSDGQEWNRIGPRVEEIEKTVAQIEARERVIQADAQDADKTDRGALFNTPAPGAIRGQDIWDLSTIRSTFTNPEVATHELMERTHRAIDEFRFPNPDVKDDKAKEHLTTLLAKIDDPPALAKHIMQTGSPVYHRAFGKALIGQQLQAQEMQALSLGGSSGAEGGYAVPVTFDPTIIPTSNLAVNPLRRIARTIQITSKEWEGVTASAVTAYRGDEGSEATESSPTLTQPTAQPGRVSAFVEATFEIAQDWSGIQGDLAMLIQDAKDVEESTSFVTGAGTGTANNAVPQGVITGATVTVNTAGTATLASTDFDLLENALPVRYRANASVLGSRPIYNKFRHFDDSGGPDLWLRLAQGIGGATNGDITLPLHGYPAYEVSTMATTTAGNSLILVLGDFRYFIIVDRIGMSIELIPHLFGANRLPVGKRGFYAFWRNTSKVLVPDAFRVLKALN